MNTPSHAIINLAILGRKQHTHLNISIAIGAILPDIPAFVFYLVSKFIYHLPEPQIWRETYFEPFWQNIFDTFHSFPLILICLAVATYCGWDKIKIFCYSMLLHSSFDLPVHTSDAHRHFFPLSDYRFSGPISYWNPNEYGLIAALVELLLVIVATFYIYRLVRSRFGKVLLILINLIYIGGYFSFMLTVHPLDSFFNCSGKPS